MTAINNDLHLVVYAKLFHRKVVVFLTAFEIKECRAVLNTFLRKGRPVRSDQGEMKRFPISLLRINKTSNTPQDKHGVIDSSFFTWQFTEAENDYIKRLPSIDVN